MSAEANKAAALALVTEVFGNQNPDAFLEGLAPDVVLYMPGYPEPFRGSQAVRDWAASYFAGFDSRITIETAVAEGENVMIRWTNHAIHCGEYQGLPPTGRRVIFTEIAHMRVVNGKGQEVWIVFDTLHIMQQLGVFPKALPPRPVLRLVVGLQRLFGSRRSREQ